MSVKDPKSRDASSLAVEALGQGKAGGSLILLLYSTRTIGGLIPN